MAFFSDRQDELRACYDEQATHFVETRKRPRPEFVFVNEWVEKLGESKQNPEIVELGCGGGRLYTELAPLVAGSKSYTGIDFATGMIREAKKAAPQAKWLVGDMVTYIQEKEQESVDLLMGIASIQHIKGARQRALFFADAYRALSRGGMMILTNRAYSDRFLKKYRKQVALSLPTMLLDYNLTRNDVLIPRKDHKNPTQQHLRYYHMFTLYELQQLARQAGFVVRTCQYVAQDGALTDDRRTARNSFLVVQKEVI